MLRSVTDSPTVGYAIRLNQHGVAKIWLIKPKRGIYMNESTVMLLIIIAIFVFLAVAGYLLETEEEVPTAPAHEAEHESH